MTAAAHVFAMNGLPWTDALIADAATRISHGGSIGFGFGMDAPAHLADLDAQVFSRRPDLQLRVWRVGDDRRFTDEDLRALAALHHVRKLEISLDKAQPLTPLASLHTLESLTLKGGKSHGLDFLPSQGNLRALELHGAFKGLESLADCHALQSLYAGSSRLDTDALLASLPDVRSLTLDGCPAPQDLSLLNRPGLESLCLSSIPKLSGLDALAAFSHLQALDVQGAAHLQRLPDMSGMRALRTLALNRLKTWSNPEALQTLPALETLTLQEINTKLRAEQFAFLPALPGLRRVDIRFIDTGARRRTGIEALFAAAGRQALLVADEDEGQDENPDSPAA